ncbi:MAG TPA: hypothetical protein PLD27_01505 [bacterium]|nr:hypothetical protein [bacterium]HOL46612.1 hypothetical protein [bacterium]HPQ17817.1 hypothetical protein [bacterium]
MKKRLIEIIFIGWAIFIFFTFYYRYFVSYIYENQGAITRIKNFILFLFSFFK